MTVEIYALRWFGQKSNGKYDLERARDKMYQRGYICMDHVK